MTDLNHPHALRWDDLIRLLTDAGLPLRRQPQPPPHSMQAHRAEWLAAGRNRGGARVWIRVLHYAGTIQARWQITAYRTQPALPLHCSTSELTRHRLLLHDPTLEQALAAAAVLGITPAGA